jgi:hypothetical protein
MSGRYWIKTDTTKSSAMQGRSTEIVPALSHATAAGDTLSLPDANNFDLNPAILGASVPGFIVC